MRHDDSLATEIMTPLDETRLARLNALFDEILPDNRFQCSRLGRRAQIQSTRDYLALPLLTKEELVADACAHPAFGTNLTYPVEAYTRYHQTSGTTGTPLRVLDTEVTWDWWGRCWLEVYRAAEVTHSDRLLFAFSFAPSIGFWSSYKSAEMLGALLIPAGGARSEQRLAMLRDAGATALLCTPSYALRLAEVAEQTGFPLRECPVRVLIHAGEPGASIPATRRRIQQAWDATPVDHSGATEVGAWGIGLPDGSGLWVNENEFVAEVIDPRTRQPTQTGETGELVLTNLGRGAWPVIRYCTGDIVRPKRKMATDGTSRLILEGGILGRADDMIVVRGVNIFPSAIENVIRDVAGSVEYRVTVQHHQQMNELTIDLEGDDGLCQSVVRRLREWIGIRVPVHSVPVGSLPRWEAKHRRFVDERGRDSERTDSERTDSRTA